VDNYGQAIRRAREAQHISQDDLCRRIAEKVSVLQNVEGGRLVPDDTVARKLEHALRIRLLQPVSKTPPAEGKFSHPLELTLGDVAVMMKGHGQRQEAEEKQNSKKRL
jgi:putative transcription factor